MNLISQILHEIADRENVSPNDLDPKLGEVVNMGIWWVDYSRDGQHVAAGVTPFEGGPGDITYIQGGEQQWTTELDNANPFHVTVSESGSYIVVGAEDYLQDGETHGQNGVQVYDSNGELIWMHETSEPVIAVDIVEAEDLVIAGTDDGRLLALNLDGELRWETDETGGYVTASQDGSTIVASDFDALTAFDPSGEQQWRVDPGVTAGWPDDLQVSDDGSTVLVFSDYESKAAVVENGEVEWTEEHTQGPIVGGLSSDGKTWGVVIDSKENEERTTVEIYETN